MELNKMVTYSNLVNSSLLSFYCIYYISTIPIKTMFVLLRCCKCCFTFDCFVFSISKSLFSDDYSLLTVDKCCRSVDNCRLHLEAKSPLEIADFLTLFYIVLLTITYLHLSFYNYYIFSIFSIF